MPIIFSAPNLATVEHDPARKRFVSHWSSYHGPHFRKGVEAMLTEARKSGAHAYIADASQAKDVPSQEDFQWIETYVKPELLKAGLQMFITVMPASSIARMATARTGKIAAQAGVQSHAVASLAEAHAVADGKKAA